MAKHYMDYPTRPLAITLRTVISADPVMCGACPHCSWLIGAECRLWENSDWRAIPLNITQAGVERCAECLALGDALEI